MKSGTDRHHADEELAPDETTREEPIPEEPAPKNRRRGLAAAAAALAALAAFGPTSPASPAVHADPPLPAATDIVSVGSETTDALDDALATAYDASTPTPASKYYSWDSYGSSPITPKAGADSIARPATSNEALSLYYQRNLYHVVRFADWTGARGPALKAFLGRKAQGCWLCTKGYSLTTSFGFHLLPLAACGVTIVPQ
ncbi:hypothetical protein [Catenulispora rubra]|uniref:hypothetical protein n=1 Tax=Catenulispora rubra TaxID=280293 RepID=UPI0018927F9E|nr:hypothetical protein [Catenulispora rubra]